ncbi:signal peptidase I [Flexivirga caeni]|uniref:Signal peptidase I n=1 Tax=Flexivirga caeni TaxID=2294115 RepID=A0A3M9MH30_9MICO|nr:signal peptidase I [Flexivirga caeni]
MDTAAWHADPHSEPSAAEGKSTAVVGAQQAGDGGWHPFRLLREFAIVVVVALILSLLIKTFVAQSFWIPSQSMENTLVPGDRVVVSKFTPGLFSLQRGDVVVFHDPGHWLDEPNTKRSGISGAVTSVLQFVGLYPSGDDDLIKRVIGLPGDHVKCCNTRGQITVNGVALSEPYIYPGGGTDQLKFSVTVPAGRVWVMGDNRGDSSDSRFHDNGTGQTGSVPESDIVGRADMIVWPIDRMGWLSNYSSTFDKVPKP